MRRSGLFAVAVPIGCLVAGYLVAGCAATPSRRPLHTSAIASGEGTTESVRKQLEGTWSLVSFTVFDAAGTAKDVPAAGRLSYDSFGNLDLTGKFKGRAVVDPGASRIVLADVEGNVDPSALPKNMGIDKVRYYAFQADTLSLETRDGARVLARTVWKKVS